MNLTCCICEKELKVPGGLAFSPPDHSTVENTGGVPRVSKYHICILCWDTRIQPILRRARDTVDPYNLGPYNPYDVVEHTHGSKNSCRELTHTHAWGSMTHSHLLRAVCGREECKGHPTHNIHEAADVKYYLDRAIDRVRISGDGEVHF